MRTRLSTAATLLVLVGCTSAAVAAVPEGNLVVNPGAEEGEASPDGSVVPVPGWTTADGFTVMSYGSPGGPQSPPDGGANFFSGGRQSNSSSAFQLVDLSAAATEIDARMVDGVLAAAWGPSEANAYIEVQFLNAAGRVLHERSIDDYEVGTDGLTRGRQRVAVPRRARQARIDLSAWDYVESYNDAHIDNVSLDLVLREVPRPERGRTVVVTPKKGRVTILDRRGHRKPITGPTSMPVGWSVDARRGAVSLVSAESAHGLKTNVGTFARGLFAVKQGSNYETQLSLGGLSRVCRRPAPRELSSTTRDDFVVLAGAAATRPRGGKVAWVARDSCDETDIIRRRGDVNIVPVGSRRATGRRVQRLLERTGCARSAVRRRLIRRRARGCYRTTGRHSVSTVRGRALVGG
jgi:hypothetical protein